MAGWAAQVSGVAPGAKTFFSAAAEADAAADAAVGDASDLYPGAAIAAARAAAAAQRYSNGGSFLWEQVREDARILEKGENPLTLLLWSFPKPDWFERNNGTLRQWWQLDAVRLRDDDGLGLVDDDGRRLIVEDPNSVTLSKSTYYFWGRWWEGVLSGQQINWDLQCAVALIPDEDWQNGPTHIAQIIARLEAQFGLRTQIADLAEKLREVEAQALTQGASELRRGHNHPPALIGAQVAVRQEIASALVELDEAEVELAKHSPSSAVLHRIGTALWRISKNIAAYCGGLADIAAKKAAEVVGETGTKAFIWTVAARYAQVDSVAKSLLEFAAKLAAGG